jgi:hypothetical protein
MRRLCRRSGNALEFILGQEDIQPRESSGLPPATALQRSATPRGNAAAPPLKGNTNVKLVEPPSCSSPSTIVFIGRNSRGQWVAQEQNGLFGGLFVNRAQAVKYALFENGHHPETIIELSRGVELDMSGNKPAPAIALAMSTARRAS